MKNDVFFLCRNEMRVVFIYREKKSWILIKIFIFFKKVLIYKNYVWIIGWEKKSKVICTANQKIIFKSYPDLKNKKKGNHDTPCTCTHAPNVLTNHFVTRGKADSNFIFFQLLKFYNRWVYYVDSNIFSTPSLNHFQQLIKCFQHPHRWSYVAYPLCKCFFQPSENFKEALHL